MADVRVSKLVKKYGAMVALHAIDLDVRDGEFMVFVGPSGSGKSTLLRCIAGLESIAEGSVSIGGVDVTDFDPADRDLSMVFQNYALFPHMTCRANLEFPLKTEGVGSSQMAERVDQAGELLDIKELLDRKPSSLSGGQRQRVAIGRAIVKEPKVFLFDEPLSNLDAELRIKMRVEIVKLQRQLQNTIIYVTHDQVEAMTMADRIVVLRNGRIEQVGTPNELYYRPKNQFVASFIGAPQMNMLPCIHVAGGDSATRIRVGAGTEISLPIDPPSTGFSDGKFALGFRPEHVSLNQPAAEALQLQLTCDFVEHLGAATNIYGTVPVIGSEVTEITVATNTSVVLQEGGAVPVWIPVSECHLFYPHSEALHRNVNPPTWE